MSEVGKRSGPSAAVRRVISMVQQNIEDHDAQSSDSEAEVVPLSNMSFQLLEELDSKLSFAEVNQKRKDLTYQAFSKPEMPRYSRSVGAVIAPINRAIQILMRRTEVISELTQCPPDGKRELQRLEAE